jgi:PadR family transcriptional regulator, regulatory protein AphA
MTSLSTMQTKIPSLGYALLGLLLKPASGYDLRKIFSSTSMRTYSDSPGAIYPALARLEKQGLIRGTIEKGSGLRRRRIFRLTPRGIAELKKWIAAPITLGELTRGHELFMLRFAFSEPVLGAAASLALLQSLQAALKPYLLALRKELEILKPVVASSGRLAFEYGLRASELLERWAQQAISTYSKHSNGGLP